MSKYETTATVEAAGLVRVAGVPFEPGTEVAVVIQPAAGGEHAGRVVADGVASDRAATLLSTLDKGRNTQPIGPLRREELYDRDVLR